MPPTRSAAGSSRLQRTEAVWRRRRILFNNDGMDLLEPAAGTPQGLLGLRTMPLAGSHVDTICYCTHHSFNLCTHRTAVAETAGMAGPDWAPNARRLVRRGRDCLQIMIGFCHRHGMELFWSMRMNDTHDAAMVERTSRFKREHPELLMGRPGEFTGYPGDPRWWCAVNYERESVRRTAWNLIDEVAHRYDVDGIELDLFRHPIYFRPQMFGRPAEPHQRAAMTQFLRSVRATTRHAETQRRRPLLLAVRVPDALEVCLRFGLDVERWVSERLIDLLIPGGYWHLAPWQEMVALGHAGGVPVYPCISGTRIRGRAANRLPQETPLTRGEALTIHHAGGDGVYLFNRFDTAAAEYRELGDHCRLRRLPRSYAQSPGGSVDRFLGARIRHRRGLLPLPLDAPRVVWLEVGERLHRERERVRLRVRISDLAARDAVAISLNDMPLPPFDGSAATQSDPNPWRYHGWFANGNAAGWLERALDPALVRHGWNAFSITAAGGGRGDLVLQDLELAVTPLAALEESDS